MSFLRKLFESLHHIKKVHLASALLVTIAFGTGYGFGQAPSFTVLPPATIINATSTGDALAQGANPAQKTDFAAFWKAWQLLDQKYIPPMQDSSEGVSDVKKVQAAIAGLASSYKDPYTTFMPKEESDQFRTFMQGEFSGIGAVLTQTPMGVLVEGTMKEMPAEKAGLKPGDIIVRVNGEPVIGMPVAEVTNKVRGPVGTPVTLTLVRGINKTEDLTITRGTIALPTMSARVVQTVERTVKKVTETVATAAASAVSAAAGVATNPESLAPSTAETEVVEETASSMFVVVLSAFTQHAMSEFVSKLQEFSTSKSDTILIDLRNNPGGYIDTAVDMASHFVPKDQLVVKELVGRTRTENPHLSRGYGTVSTSTKKIYVLVNRNSASASEILAGALQDYHIATVVGEKTFGKGSAQELIDLGTAGSLKVTVARWFLPLGRSINETGVMPDLKIGEDLSKYASSTDPFFDAALDLIASSTMITSTSTTP